MNKLVYRMQITKNNNSKCKCKCKDKNPIKKIKCNKCSYKGIICEECYDEILFNCYCGKGIVIPENNKKDNWVIIVNDHFKS